MAEAVYLLCALTSVVCSILLFRGYQGNRTRLLFWSSLCFVGLAVNNVLLFVDLVIVPAVDLSILRSCVALVAIGLLLVGFVWDSR